jgi:tetratricopeptide (TPR) repeat protein
LHGGGLPAAWFVAGWTLAVGGLVRMTPVLAVLLAAPMLPWDGAAIRMGAFVLGTGVALFFLEKKLSWYLYRKPGLMRGVISPEVEGGEKGGDGVDKFFGGVAKIMRVGVSLALLGVIGAALWVFGPSYQEREAHRKSIQSAMDLVEKGKAESALKKFLKLEEKYPNEPDVLLGLSKAYTLGEDNENAMKYAALYADWEPKPVEATSKREELYKFVMDLFESEAPSFNRAAAYEYILNSQRPGEATSDFARDLAMKTLALKPDSLAAISMMAKESVLRNEADDTISYAERALKLDPRGRERHLQAAEAYSMKKDWARVIAECDRELELFPDSERAVTIRQLAVRFREKMPKEPPAAKP